MREGHPLHALLLKLMCKQKRPSHTIVQITTGSLQLSYVRNLTIAVINFAHWNVCS